MVIQCSIVLVEPTTVGSLWLENDTNQNELQFEFLYGKIEKRVSVISHGIRGNPRDLKSVPITSRYIWYHVAVKPDTNMRLLRNSDVYSQILTVTRIYAVCHQCQVSKVMENVMMASSNGNIFRVTGHLCREFTGHRWIPRTKAGDSELWCFLWSAPE